MKKFLIFILLSVFCFNVINAEVTWKIEGNTLTISGTGDMGNYSYISNAPWISQRESIKNIIITNGVTSIGSYAFYTCSRLTSVTIPNSVTSIGDMAFYECTTLTSVTIPNSVTSIACNAFRDCSSLTSVIVEQGNKKYDSRNNSNAIIETESNTLVCGFKNTAIPNTVTCIGNSAFSGCNTLSSITIPNSVTSIGSSAFEYCI